MPVYNGEMYLRQALDALLAQTFTDFELIISDNASVDQTQKICLEYTAQDKRILYYRNKNNSGSLWNFNQVFSLSKGKYFMWASCHDLWEDTFISRCIEVLEEEREVVLCYPMADWINMNGDKSKEAIGVMDTRGLDRISRCHVVLWGLQYAFPICGFFRAGVLRQKNAFTLSIGADAILLFELSLLGEFAQIPERLLHIRQMPDFGSLDAYIKKLFSKPMRSSRRLFWCMLFEYLRIINRHIRSIPARFFLMFSTLSCILVRYRWIWHGLSKRRQ